MHSYAHICLHTYVNTEIARRAWRMAQQAARAGGYCQGSGCERTGAGVHFHNRLVLILRISEHMHETNSCARRMSELKYAGVWELKYARVWGPKYAGFNWSWCRWEAQRRARPGEILACKCGAPFQALYVLQGKCMRTHKMLLCQQSNGHSHQDGQTLEILASAAQRGASPGKKEMTVSEMSCVSTTIWAHATKLCVHVCMYVCIYVHRIHLWKIFGCWSFRITSLELMLKKQIR